MSEKDWANMLNILDCAQKIQTYMTDFNDADSFYVDTKTFDAVLMNFVVIGETVSKISDSFKDKNNQIPWTKVKDFRNLIAHDYFGIDAEEVWQIIKNHLPILISDLEDTIETN